jgi:hypothetical protein
MQCSGYPHLSGMPLMVTIASLPERKFFPQGVCQSSYFVLGCQSRNPDRFCRSLYAQVLSARNNPRWRGQELAKLKWYPTHMGFADHVQREFPAFIKRGCRAPGSAAWANPAGDSPWRAMGGRPSL